MEASEGIQSEQRFGSLWPAFPKCERAAKTSIAPLLERGAIVILPGYLGRGPAGEVVTLRRGGSHLSPPLLPPNRGASPPPPYQEGGRPHAPRPENRPGPPRLPRLHLPRD